MIAVTGATGHLGRLVVDALLARGVAPEQIVAAVRTPARASDLAALGVAVREADYSRPETLVPALEGVKTLLLVSSSEVGRRAAQHANVIDAAKAAGVERIVYTSAPHADTSTLILAPEHKATEELLTASGLATTILRNNWYTENYAPALEQARESGVISASVGEGRVASATRKDFAEAAAVVLIRDDQAGKVYELTGDLAWTHEELARAASEILGREVTYRSLTSAEHAAALAAAGLDEGTAGFLVALDANIREGLLGEVTNDLTDLLGRPTTPLTEGLAAALEATSAS
ncbi:NAD(P)H dehydrogenase (quinone) [Sanguibacter gelidistatuariae]|uniref:NAD(P)H dehydrogenase (Quinone) n=1 Tax=Sanguibacter gelidistatuariae TaxID=1814289 RepID=A0A1G6L4W8_9MICO|nr:SDR family oxidoreductase [Sanguibacter gelidistatuariae]SDC38168.1 NAD(P)H dehydrogenase (quinone) [Sanguibacter gelidistatuariae]